MDHPDGKTGDSQRFQADPPAVRTSFIGRRREKSEVAGLLQSSRLVTLSGAAGCGKTRLALRVAQDLRDRYPGGVYWVELAQLADRALVARAVARVLGVPEPTDRAVLAGVVDALRGRNLLLVLDNCEHILEGCARLAETLLAETGTTVLATSREPLGVRGEMQYRVTPLAPPPADHPAQDVDGIGSFDAVQLFVERAQAVRPGFELTAANANAVADICRRLDGIPLAIELASARVNVLASQQIATRLDACRNLLSAAGSQTRSHHTTMQAALDWSHGLLSKPAQVLLRRLSVFKGGCSLAAVEKVCGGEGVGEEQLLDHLTRLVTKSLLTADTQDRQEARYLLLEPIRQYAEEKLAASGERPAIRDRHLHYYLALTEATAPKLKGHAQQLWLNRLEDEYDNVRAALAWSLASDRIEAGLRIAVAVYQFWHIRGYAGEGADWLRRLLARAGERLPARLHANALAYASTLAEARGDRESQIAYGDAAAALAENLDDDSKSALVWAVRAQAFGARAAGDEETGFALCRRVVQLFRELGERDRLASALITCSIAASSLGEFAEARRILDEGLPLVRETGNPHQIAMALNFSGDLARCEQDYRRATVAYRESIDLLRELDARRDLASALHNLGHAYLHLDGVARARTLFEESLALHRTLDNRPGMAECLIGFAGLAIAEGDLADGARLLAAAAAPGGEQAITAWAATRMEYNHYLSTVRSGMVEEEFQAAQAAGGALSLERALSRARLVADEATAAERAREKVAELTPREREVAALVAQARSNGEIASELVISKRTVEKHISHIRSKLSFTKRAQIVRWALAAGLVEHPGPAAPP